MDIYFSLLLFFLGACFGSFLLLIGMRLPKKHPIALARSECAHCQKSLQAFDLVPLLSFLFLRGHCRYCRHKIAASHFWFELVGGVILLVLWEHHGREPIIFLYYALLYSVLFIMAAVDIHYLYFPDRFQVALLILLLIRANIIGSIDWQQAILGGIVLMLILYLAELVSPGGLGGGDKKLLLTFTLTIGLQPMLTILFWASLGCVVAFCGRNLRTRSLSSLPLPFGPFLALAFFLIQEGFLGMAY